MINAIGRELPEHADAYGRVIPFAGACAAANAVANVIPEESLAEDYVIPSVFDERVAPTVARTVAEAGRNSGAAREALQEEGNAIELPLVS